MKQQVDKLVGHSEHLLDAFLGLRQKVALLFPMVRNESLIVKYSRGAGAEGFLILRYTLFCSCAQDLVKLTTDTDKRTPSVENLFSILQDVQVRNELRERYSAWCLPREAGHNEIETELQAHEMARRGELAKKFDDLFRKVGDGWANFKVQPWLPGMQSLRDKHTAHLELRPTNHGYEPVGLEALNLKWGDVRDAVTRLEGLVLDLNVLSRQAGFMMDQATDQFDRAATAFWEAS